ncbi:MAG: adenylate cyclase [Proteobacteria bacterium]|nr:adenylate cyclase [Pseudomonadota bacterium]
MAVESEIKLAIPVRAARQLAMHPLLVGRQAQTCRLLNAYFDTPEGALAATGLALRFRRKHGKWLMTVKRDDAGGGTLTQRQEWEFPAVPGQFDFALVGCPKVRRLLCKNAAHLTEIFTTHFLRRSWLLDHGTSRIEVALDRGQIAAGESMTPICEIELELIDGDVADLFDLAMALQAELPLRPMIASKAERGFALSRQTEAKPFRAQSSNIRHAMSPEAAFRVLAQACLIQLQRNENAGKWREGPEFTHQARVALRRLRSLLKLFAPILPNEFVAEYGQRWKAFADVLGEARNWDVLIGETLPPILGAFAQDRQLPRCRALALKQADCARAAVEKMFAGGEYGKLLLDFSAALFTLEETPPLALAEFAHKRLRQQARKARRLAHFPGNMKADDWHQLRIELKKLRYWLEFCAPLLPHKPLKTYLHTLNPILQELGLLNDLETARESVDRLFSGRSPELLQGWLAGRQAQLLEDLPLALENWFGQKLPRK